MKKECLAIDYVDVNVSRKADYTPNNFKEAKKQLIEACKGKTNINQIMGLNFRLVAWEGKEVDKWTKFATSICNTTIKKYNGLQPRWYDRWYTRWYMGLFKK